MNYCGLKKIDIADGPGVRVSLFVSGCRNHCPDCFQPETWDFNYGEPFTKKTEDEFLEALRPSWIQGFSILGGDPLEPENAAVLVPFLSRLRKELPGKDVWLYTGYTYEDVSDAEILKLTDVLVDGRFIESQRNPSLAFRGSSNQRIIEIPASRREGRAVLWEEKL